MSSISRFLLPLYHVNNAYGLLTGLEIQIPAGIEWNNLLFDCIYIEDMAAAARLFQLPAINRKGRRVDSSLSIQMPCDRRGRRVRRKKKSRSERQACQLSAREGVRDEGQANRKM